MPPPSLRHMAKWKGFGSGSQLSSRGGSCTVDYSVAPILEPPSGDGCPQHPYVTRSLFREAENSQKEADVIDTVTEPAIFSPLVPPSGINTPVVSNVGVVKDVFVDSLLDGCVSWLAAYPDYICCEVITEFVDDVSNMQKVTVRLRHNGHTEDIFRSCCDFSAEFLSCTHSTPEVQNSLAVVMSQDLEGVPENGILGTILSQSYHSDSDQDWTEEKDCLQDSHSEEGSDWEQYEAEICHEDLPRLGILEMDPNFNSAPFDWRMADENWPQSQTTYSHSTEFLGADPEPLPSWVAGISQE
ncbi:hypothetical protein R1sor_018387 [Riccia sorocarpa]|uniref:Uncharacterized protein n=1 Tax=Riccia sorocarpa TaxID=122646 RepID=A0ABD3I9J3_9MARC